MNRLLRVLSILICAAVLSAVVLPGPGIVGAQEADGPAVGEPTADAAAYEVVTDPDRWWGVAGTILCGAGIRVMRIPGIGLNPWVLAPTIGGCLLGLLDAVTSSQEHPA